VEEVNRTDEFLKTPAQKYPFLPDSIASVFTNFSSICDQGIIFFPIPNFHPINTALLKTVKLSKGVGEYYHVLNV